MFNFRKKEKSKRDKFELILNIRVDIDRVYNNASVANELLFICSKFGVEIQKFDYCSIDYTDTIILSCTLVELHMIIDELYKKFPKITVEGFKKS